MRKLIGHVQVEGGNLMIIDPVHLDQWESGEFDKDLSTYPTCGYEEASKVALAQKEFTPIFRSLAFLLSMGKEEMKIPVYGTFDEEGKIIKLELEFERVK